MRNLIVWGLIIGLGAAVNFFTDSRRSNAGEVVAAGNESVFELRVGDCIQEMKDGGEVSNTRVVPCSMPHEYEVFANFDLPTGEYPGRDQVLEFSAAGCQIRFDDYFQVDYQVSKLDINALFPTQESWNQISDRSVSCLGYKMDGTSMIGQVRGI